MAEHIPLDRDDADACLAASHLYQGGALALVKTASEMLTAHDATHEDIDHAASMLHDAGVLCRNAAMMRRRSERLVDDE